MFIKIDKTESVRLLKRAIYDLTIIVISVSVIYFAMVAYAGNLNPPVTGTPAATMNSTEDVYKALADPAYVPSAPVAPAEDGNILEILKCITNKIDHGTCI